MLTAQRLRELFDYDPLTGIFRRRKSCGGAGFWKPVGSMRTDGYLSVSIDGTAHRLHRLAFLYMTGAEPPEDTDHINGIKDDNRWCNLRAATTSENMCNSRRYSTNTSGCRGVTWNKRRGAWAVRVAAHGFRHFLGYFDSLETAKAARDTFALQAQKEFVRFDTLPN